MKSEVRLFYSRLLNPDISFGASDYYVVMMFFDVLCLITIICGVSSFGVSSSEYFYNSLVCMSLAISLVLNSVDLLMYNTHV